MDDSIILGLIHNVAILLVFSFIYDYSWVKGEDHKKTSGKIITGLVIGGLGIILMLTPWTFVPGIVFDTRSILLSISGLFFGTIPTIVAMVITGIFRLTMGGDGLWMGLAVILSSGSIGILWKVLRPGWKEKNYLLELLILGILVHTVMLGCAFLLPADLVIPTIRSIVIPLIAIYFPATLLLGLLMVKQFANWQNRKAMDKLRTAEEQKLQFGNILEASLNEIFVFDSETLLYKYANYGAINNLGYSVESIKQLTPSEIQPDYNLSSFRALLTSLISGEKKLIQYETRNRRMNGSYYPVEVHMQFFEYSDEKVFLAVVQDITDRKHWEDQLIIAIKKAEENDRLKSIFLSNMSHEIRTPMNAIIGFSDLLSKPGVDASKQSFFIDIIKNSSNRLLRIINDILDISKLEAKQLSLSPEDCLISDIFIKSIEAFRNSDLLLEKPGISLQLKIPEKYNDLRILMDKNRVQQVIDNLITNAIKYTESGSVEIGYKLKDLDEISCIEIFVKDTGIGIPKEKYDLVFERFRQVEEKTYHAGAGLGLSISKGLVDLWGGRIWFTSKINTGSTFYFTIPISKSKINKVQTSCNEEDRIDLSNKSILIAEDDYNSYIYLKELLIGKDMDIVYAENGQILMDIIEKRNFDLVILDMHMPVKSGYTCLQEMQKKGIRARIIIQTAYAMSEEKERCLNMGCQGFISKPVSPNEFYKIINLVMKEQYYTG